jgi:phospholipase/carboxylesterase
MITNHHTRDFSNGKPKNLAIILHGYGADGENLVDLADFFAPHIESPTFIVPDAPFPHEYAPNFGRQWFSLMNRDEAVLMQGATIAYEILTKFIEEKLEEYGLGFQNLILIGFSQGTMMSLFAGLKISEQCRGIIGFSGTIVSAEDTISTCKSKPPVCLIHGIDDDVVPCTLGKFTAKVLKSNGFDVQLHEIPNLGHSIEMNGIKHAQNFLKNLK